MNGFFAMPRPHRPTRRIQILWVDQTTGLFMYSVVNKCKNYLTVPAILPGTHFFNGHYLLAGFPLGVPKPVWLPDAFNENPKQDSNRP